MKEIWEQCTEVQEDIEREEQSCLLLNILLGAILSLLLSTIMIMVLVHIFSGVTTFHLWIGMLVVFFIICLGYVHKDYQEKTRNVFNRACIIENIFLDNKYDIAGCRTFSDSTYYAYNTQLCETTLGSICADHSGKILKQSDHIKSPVTIQVNTKTKVPSIVTITNGNLIAYFDAQEINGALVYNLINTSTKSLLLMCKHEGDVFLVVNNDREQLTELDKASIAKELFNTEF